MASLIDLINLLTKFEFTVYGGIAIHFMLCTIFVTGMGLYYIFAAIFTLISKLFKKNYVKRT